MGAVRDAALAALLIGGITLMACMAVPDAMIQWPTEEKPSAEVARLAMTGFWMLSAAWDVVLIGLISFLIRLAVTPFLRHVVTPPVVRAAAAIESRIPPVPARLARALTVTGRILPPLALAAVIAVGIAQQPDGFLAFATALIQSPDIWFGLVVVGGFVAWGRVIARSERRRRAATEAHNG